MLFRPPKFIKRLMPSLVWNMEGEKDVFLTFDDGPTPGVTEWVLEELSKHNAKATFFCLGKNAEQYPDLHQAIVDAGHKVGNHTYSHQKGWGMSLENYVEDIDFANQILKSDLFRPPYGRIKPSQARVISERYNMIMWDVLSRDYSSMITPKKCLENVTKYVREGSIVVFHDSNKSLTNLHYVLPKVLDYLDSKGLKASSINL
ncbi:MAG: polysaccharide deacetylase family protein [Rikenellaceae bacterium]